MKISFQFCTAPETLRASMTLVLPEGMPVSALATRVQQRFQKSNSRSLQGAMVAWAGLRALVGGCDAASASAVDGIVSIQPSGILKHPWSVTAFSAATAFWNDRQWLGFPEVVGAASSSNRSFILRDSREVLETVEAVLDTSVHVLSLRYSGVLLASNKEVHSELIAHAVDRDDLEDLMANDPTVLAHLHAAQATANRAFVRLAA